MHSSTDRQSATAKYSEQLTELVTSSLVVIVIHPAGKRTDLTMPPKNFEEVIHGSTWDINGLCALQVKSVDSIGKTLCEGAKGKRFLGTEDTSEANSDTIFWIASCTKLVVTIAALQCVERGLVMLDQNLTGILPELMGIDLLHGWDDEGNPKLSRPKTQPTLRQLLSHQSGIGVDISEPILIRWNEYKQRATTSQTGDVHDLLYPRVFEVEEGWTYSVGFDWAGLLISRLNNNMTLGEYFEANIFQPLGLKNTTFDPRTSSDMMNRLTGTHYRQPDGSLKCESNVGFPYAKSGNCNGGGGLWSTANDFCQILQSAFLRREGQQQILSESTANEICQPCLRNPQYLEDRLAAMKVGINLDMIPHVPKDDPKNFGLGVVINLKELETGLSANSGQWSGFPNCYWWVDLHKGVVGVLISAVLNFADPQVVEIYKRLQKVSYIL